MGVGNLKLRIADIVRVTEGELLCGSAGGFISGISTDSRNIRAGQLFWALRGERFDGHDFTEQAVCKGAGALVIEKDRAQDLINNVSIPVIGVSNTLFALGELAKWWRRIHDVKIAGITGSAGKTTTKEMTWLILNKNLPTLKNPGNFNNLIGLPISLLELDNHHKRAVLEMGMNRPGEIGRLTEISAPDVGLITRVSEAHLEGVGDIRGVLEAKLELAVNISSDAVLIINGDDDLLIEGISKIKRNVIRFGLGSDNHVRAYDIRENGPKGAFFRIRHEKGVIEVTLSVPGIHNVYNACASVAICLAMGENEDTISEALSEFRPIKGRCNIIELSHGGLLIDDTYNSNPASLRAAIELAIKLMGPGKRLIIGLGEMLELGKKSEQAHKEAGQVVAKARPSLFVAMGDHSAHMLQGAREGGLSPHVLEIAENHIHMADAILDVMKNGDIVLIKGSRRIGLEKVVDKILKVKGVSSFNDKNKGDNTHLCSIN